MYPLLLSHNKFIPYDIIYPLLHARSILVNLANRHAYTLRAPACSRTICYIAPSNFMSDSSFRPQESIYMETNGTSVSDVQSSRGQRTARLDNFFSIPVYVAQYRKGVTFPLSFLLGYFLAESPRKIIGLRSRELVIRSRFCVGTCDGSDINPGRFHRVRHCRRWHRPPTAPSGNVKENPSNGQRSSICSLTT